MVSIGSPRGHTSLTPMRCQVRVCCRVSGQLASLWVTAVCSLLRWVPRVPSQQEITLKQWYVFCSLWRTYEHCSPPIILVYYFITVMFFDSYQSSASCFLRLSWLKCLLGQDGWRPYRFCVWIHKWIKDQWKAWSGSHDSRSANADGRYVLPWAGISFSVYLMTK